MRIEWDPPRNTNWAKSRSVRFVAFWRTQMVPFRDAQVCRNDARVGGFNPSEKYARQIGSSPQIGMNIKNIWIHHLVLDTSAFC